MRYRCYLCSGQIRLYERRRVDSHFSSPKVPMIDEPLDADLVRTVWYERGLDKVLQAASRLSEPWSYRACINLKGMEDSVAVIVAFSCGEASQAGRRKGTCRVEQACGRQVPTVFTSISIDVLPGL